MAVKSQKKQERFLQIDELIAKEPHKHNWQSMCRELGCKKSQFYRDIKTLENEYGAPIDTDWEDRYFYTDLSYRLPAFFQPEFAKLLKDILDLVKDNPIYERVYSYFANHERIYPDNTDELSAKARTEYQRIIFTGPQNINVSPETFRIIKEALDRNVYLTFNYVAYENPYEEKKHTVMPFQLIFDNGNWNLHCRETVDRKDKRFTLSGMKNIQLYQAGKGKIPTFTLPEDYDFRKSSCLAFGCFDGNVKEQYEIHLHGYAARYARDRIWGENQTIEKDENNSGNSGEAIILKFESTQNAPIQRWVWSWADEAIPLKPESLVKDWEERKKRVLEM